MVYSAFVNAHRQDSPQSIEGNQLSERNETTAQHAALYDKDGFAPDNAEMSGPGESTLRRINSRLITETDYDAILNVLVSESVRQMGASDAAVLCYEPKRDRLRRLSVIRNYEAVITQPDHPLVGAEGYIAVADMPLWGLLKPGEMHIRHFSSPNPDGLLPPALEQWHRQHGHTLCLRSLLAIGAEPVGWIGISFLKQVEPGDPLLNMFRIFTQQLAFVLQSRRLSELARHETAMVAVAEERSRIAGDMHDTLAHSFTGILMQLEAAKELLHTRVQIAADCLDRATSVARDGLRQSRLAVMALQEPRPELLTETLPSLVHGSEVNLKPVCKFQTEGVARHLPGDIDQQLFRIGQEAFSNAQRYSGAANIEILLSFTPTGVMLAVRDDGVGFNLTAMNEIGFGISSMNKRAERIGADLVIESHSGMGTVVHVRWSEQIPRSDRSSEQS